MKGEPGGGGGWTEVAWGVPTEGLQCGKMESHVTAHMASSLATIPNAGHVCYTSDTYTHAD